MRDLSKLLGWVVLGVTAAGCGGATKGSLGPGGARTEGERLEAEDKCTVWEDWSYTIDPAVVCEEALSLASNCKQVCGGTETSCSGTDATGQPVVVGTSMGAACSATGSRPAEVTCRRVLSRKAGCNGGGGVEGRRPDGLHAVDAAPFESIAAYFAHAAHLEAAAVLAFERLEVELREQGAPPALVGRLRRAAREERRHVEITSELARTFGAEPLPATAEPFVQRSLFEIARENVVEGVVRETFGAAVALFRAERAQSPEVRASLSEIAQDECRHAQLSWDLHAWMWSWLGAAERKAIEGARVAAIEELREAIRIEPASELVVIAGVPPAREALELFEGLFAHAWKKVA